MNSNHHEDHLLCQPSPTLHFASHHHHHDLTSGNYYSSSGPLDYHTNVIDSNKDHCDPSLPMQSHNLAADDDQADKGFKLLNKLCTPSDHDHQNHEENSTHCEDPMHQVVDDSSSSSSSSSSTPPVTLKNSLLQVPYLDLHFENDSHHLSSIILPVGDDNITLFGHDDNNIHNGGLDSIFQGNQIRLG